MEPSIISNFQTVLNVSKAKLGRQLRAPAAPEAAGTPLHFYSDDVRRRAPEAERQDRAAGALQQAQQAQRKYRLLVVLEPRAAMKAKAEAPERPPVEAPQPAKKKG